MKIPKISWAGVSSLAITALLATIQSIREQRQTKILIEDISRKVAKEMLEHQNLNNI